MIFVKPGSAFEPIFRYIEDEAFIFRVKPECVPRNGKQLVSQAEEATEGKNRICNLPIRGINHYSFEFAKILFLEVDDFLADQRLGIYYSCSCCYSHTILLSDSTACGECTTHTPPALSKRVPL